MDEDLVDRVVELLLDADMTDVGEYGYGGEIVPRWELDDPETLAHQIIEAVQQHLQRPKLTADDI